MRNHLRLLGTFPLRKQFIFLMVVTASAGWIGCDSPLDETSGEFPNRKSTGTPRVELEPTTQSGGLGRVIFSPSVSAAPSIDYDPTTGRIMLRAASLKTLLRHAYSVNPKQIEIEIPIDPRRRYDALIEPDQPSLLLARNLLRERLEREFNMITVHEERVVPVFLLQQIDGREEPPESQSTKRVIQNFANRFRGNRASMADLAQFASLISYKPALDRTGLLGLYDIELEWEESKGAQAVHEAFRKVGFQLVDGEGPVRFLVVRRPRTDDPLNPPVTP